MQFTFYVFFFSNLPFVRRRKRREEKFRREKFLLHLLTMFFPQFDDDNIFQIFHHPQACEFNTYGIEKEGKSQIKCKSREMFDCSPSSLFSIRTIFMLLFISLDLNFLSKLHWKMKLFGTQKTTPLSKSTFYLHDKSFSFFRKIEKFLRKFPPEDCFAIIH